MLKKLTATFAFVAIATSANADSGTTASARYIGDVGLIVFSDDGSTMLFDFPGRAEICQISADREFAVCGHQRAPISIGSETVRFMGHEFLRQ